MIFLGIWSTLHAPRCHNAPRKIPQLPTRSLLRKNADLNLGSHRPGFGKSLPHHRFSQAGPIAGAGELLPSGPLSHPGPARGLRQKRTMELPWRSLLPTRNLGGNDRLSGGTFPARILCLGTGGPASSPCPQRAGSPLGRPAVGPRAAGGPVSLPLPDHGEGTIGEAL